MPRSNCNTFILLSDFRGGADGRVWLASSLGGKPCVIKFFVGKTPKERKEALTKELEIWTTLYSKYANAFIASFPDDEEGLIMPFVKNPTEEEWKTKEVCDAVKNAVTEFITKLKRTHGDISRRHVGIFTSNKVIHAFLFDFGKSEELSNIEDIEKEISLSLSKLNIK